jgi:signal transduction histidine kinase
MIFCGVALINLRNNSNAFLHATTYLLKQVLPLLSGVSLTALLLVLSVGCTPRETPLYLTEDERTWLAEHPRIVVALEANYPPYIFESKTGDAAGISAEYVDLFSKRLEVEFVWETEKCLADILEKAKRREVDMVTSVMHSESRAAYLLFTQPFSDIPAGIIVNTKDRRNLSLESMTDLRVAVAESYAIEEYLRKQYPNLNLVLVQDDLEGLRQVSFGEVDAYVGDLGTISFQIERQGLGNLRVAGDVDFNYRLSFATRSDWPMLNRILIKTYASIREEQRQAIFRRWVQLARPSLLNSPFFRIGVPLVLGLLIFFLSWNWFLRKAVRLKTADLRKEIAIRVSAEQELQTANERLEKRVEERTQELLNKNEALRSEVQERKEAQEELAAAREIATCTVHNIGNVLNSLVVGASMLQNNLELSRAESLQKISDLLQKHRDELGTFFSEDPRAAKIPDYLVLLAKSYSESQQEAMAEVKAILEKIELIKQATVVQQSFAVNRSESSRLSDLVEDALKITLSTEAGKKIQLERKYSFKDEIAVNRSKLAHVFLNLVKNAKEAMGETPDAEKHLTISIDAVDKDHVEVRFRDSGQGIAPENMEKMFTFGFTTKKDGHGFGLKYCAETMRRMGGDLRVQSEGLGKGAEFTVSLPLA